jgi:hypothetical protein
MMTIQSLVLLSFFYCWFLLTIVCQLDNGVIAKIRRKDLFHLIPNWRLFAPAPLKVDYHLEYRLRLEAAEVTEWQEIQLVAQRTYLSAIWYPQKRVRKAFSTYTRRLTAIFRKYGQTAGSRSRTCITILDYLQHELENSDAEAMQFRIISQQDFAKTVSPKVVFISDWHAPTL